MIEEKPYTNKEMWIGFGKFLLIGTFIAFCGVMGPIIFGWIFF